MLLHEAAAIGNLRAVADAIVQNPNDVNLLDEAHRSVLFCAIAGSSLRHPAPASPERNAILKAILARPELSIYALNAAMDCAQGATPLILACRVGHLDQVNTLLDCPSVLVNTRDALGLTPLMHAAHGQHHQIVVALLRAGAHANLLDPQSRSVLDYSTDPAVRFHLENQLRIDRGVRSTPPSRASSPSTSSSNTSGPSVIMENPLGQSGQRDCTPVPPSAAADALFRSLICSINTQDLNLLRSSLDMIIHHAAPSPALRSNKHSAAAAHCFAIVNRLDDFGFAPIHYAMMCHPPNFALLDALFVAGADVNLLTSKGQSPLQVLVQYATVMNHHEGQAVRLFVRHLIHDLQASIRYRDDQFETCLHTAAEHGACCEVLEALVECDTEGTVREWKNKRGLRPADIAKPHFRDVFDERPDSICTIRPALRPQRSLGSVSSFTSFTSSPTISTPATPATGFASLTLDDVEITSMSLQDALNGSQILLDEIDLSLLQRTLFYRSSLEIDARQSTLSQCKPIDECLARTSKSVVGYWYSCLATIREELDTTHRSIVKSHLLVARTKRDVEQKSRDDERELTEAILFWEEQKVAELTGLKEQARGRAFTAPARIATPAESSPSDSDALQKFWGVPRRWPGSGSTTPLQSNNQSSSDLASKRPGRMASFIKQKLRPLSRPPGPRKDGVIDSPTPPEPSPVRTRPPRLPSLDFRDVHNLSLAGEKPLPSTPDENTEQTLVIPPSSQSTPHSPASSTFRTPLTRTVSTRRTIRKAPVVLTRIHTDLLRMEEYARGIHGIAAEFQQEIAKAERLIEHCLIRCAQVEENEYEDEIQVEKLRALLLFGLERRLDELCQALDVVKAWNKLVRSLLRDFRRKVKGTDNLEHV